MATQTTTIAGIGARQQPTAPAPSGNGMRPASPVATLSAFLDKLKPQMALALPKTMTADRMTRLALSAFSSNRTLQACTHQSIAASLMTASALGLEPGVTGQGFLVPYKNRDGEYICQFIPGWRGLVDLVSRSGRATVWTGAVFQGDEFDFALGDSPFVMHKPGDEDRPEFMTHVYAIGRVNGSSYPVIEVWTIAKVWKHRDRFNRQGNLHYSNENPEMYARKTPLLQVLKYMPMSVQLANAVAVSQAAEEGRTAIIDADLVQLSNDPPPELPAAQQQPAKRGRPPAAAKASAAANAPAEQEAQPDVPDAKPSPMTYAQVADLMMHAGTLDELESAANLIDSVANEEHQEELRAKYKELRG